jgi:hypothetical protein
MVTSPSTTIDCCASTCWQPLVSCSQKGARERDSERVQRPCSRPSTGVPRESSPPAWSRSGWVRTSHSIRATPCRVSSCRSADCSMGPASTTHRTMLPHQRHPVTLAHVGGHEKERGRFRLGIGLHAPDKNRHRKRRRQGYHAHETPPSAHTWGSFAASERNRIESSTACLSARTDPVCCSEICGVSRSRQSAPMEVLRPLPLQADSPESASPVPKAVSLQAAFQRGLPAASIGALDPALDSAMQGSEGTPRHCRAQGAFHPADLSAPSALRQGAIHYLSPHPFQTKSVKDRLGGRILPDQLRGGGARPSRGKAIVVHGSRYPSRFAGKTVFSRFRADAHSPETFRRRQSGNVPGRLAPDQGRAFLVGGLLDAQARMKLVPADFPRRRNGCLPSCDGPRANATAMRTVPGILRSPSHWEVCRNPRIQASASSEVDGPHWREAPSNKGLLLQGSRSPAARETFSVTTSR